MKRVAYSQHMLGRLTAVGPGLVDVELTGAQQTPLGVGATIASQLSFATPRFFSADGTLAVDGEPALRLHTIGRGVLAPSPDDHLRHGTAMFDACGIGALSGARGRITSNFLVTADGALTDEQVVVLFIYRQEGELP
ncbi:MAG TPA: hypothetical protein VGR11_14750 [Solirubrobacteraceae bacterium]|nr:hypothetical protein [Solirubrobacteraceae bacterium]